MGCEDREVMQVDASVPGGIIMDLGMEFDWVRGMLGLFGPCSEPGLRRLPVVSGP
jgi:hypothetical protein